MYSFVTLANAQSIFPRDACRMCLWKSCPRYHIYGSLCSTLGLIDKHNELFTFQIARNDGLPQYMCIACAYKLDLLYDYIRDVKRSYHKVMLFRNAVPDLLPDEESSDVEVTTIPSRNHSTSDEEYLPVVDENSNAARPSRKRRRKRGKCPCKSEVPHDDKMCPNLAANQLPSQVTDQVPIEVEDEVPSQVANEVPSQAANQIPSRVADQVSSRTEDKIPSQVVSKVPSQVADKVPSKAANKVPSQVADTVPSEAANKVPSQVTDTVPSEAANKVPSQVANKISSEVASKVLSQVADKIPSQVADKVPSEAANKVPSQTADQVSSQVVNKISSQVASKVPSQVADKVPSQVSSKVSSKAARKVRSQVADQVPSQVSSKVSSKTPRRVQSQVANQVPSKTPRRVRSQVADQVPSQDSSKVSSKAARRVQSQIADQVPSQVANQVKSPSVVVNDVAGSSQMPDPVDIECDVLSDVINLSQEMDLEEDCSHEDVSVGNVSELHSSLGNISCISDAETNDDTVAAEQNDDSVLDREVNDDNNNSSPTPHRGSGDKDSSPQHGARVRPQASGEANVVRRKGKTMPQFSCSRCPEKFTTKVQMNLHYCNSVYSLDVSCRYCHKQFSDRADLVAHKKVHMELYNHHCPACKEAFQSPKALRAHQNTECIARSTGGGSRSTTPLPTPLYECPTCHRDFTSLTGEKIHRSSRMHRANVAKLRLRRKGPRNPQASLKRSTSTTTLATKEANVSATCSDMEVDVTEEPPTEQMTRRRNRRRTYSDDMWILDMPSRRVPSHERNQERN